MTRLITSQLDKIQDPVKKAFAFRVYNVFKSVILPIILGMTYVQLQNNPNDLSCLLEAQFWFNMAYAIIVALVGSAIAGLEKANRVIKEG